MAQTHFNESAVWMNLISVDEFNLLCKLFKNAWERRRLLNWNVNFEKTKWIDDPKLGKRLHLVISRPKSENVNNYLYGVEHHEWEAIKAKIYAERRKLKKSLT